VDTAVKIVNKYGSQYFDMTDVIIKYHIKLHPCKLHPCEWISTFEI